MLIDHVIYATEDLDRAAASIEADFGLEAISGGRHEGLGTHNRIVPLGGGYLELLAVADRAEALGSELGRRLLGHLDAEGDGLLVWCVAVDDVEREAERLGTAVTGVAREGLTARLTGLEEALTEPSLPFFITRDPGVPDPGAGGDAGGITWVELAGDRERVERRLGDGELPLRYADGPPGVLAMGIGERELPTA